MFCMKNNKFLMLKSPQVEAVHEMQSSDFGEGLTLLGERFVE